MFGRIRKYFQAQKDPIAAGAVSLPKGEIGYAMPSMLYSGRDFTRYNPDSLYSYKGSQVYDRMLHDDQVKAVLEFKIGAVVSRDWYFDVQEDSETGEEVEEQREIADCFYAMVEQMQGCFTDKLVELLAAVKYGFVVAEKIFAPFEYEGKSYWGISDLKVRPNDTLLDSMQVDPHGNLLAIKQKVSGREVELPLPKVVHFVHRPEIDRHYGESDLRAAYRSWWAKDIAIKFQNIHLERSAGGFIWAQIDATKGSLTATDKANLEKVLQNISASTGIHVPASVTLNTIQPLKTDAYEAAVAQHDKAISKALLVPNLLGISEQGDVGSYSQSEIQLEVFFWVLDLIATRLEDTLNDQLFAQLAEFNFGTKDFPPFRFEPISDKEKSAIAARWSELVSKGAVTRTDADEAHIRQLLGFPEKPEEEEPEEPAPGELSPGEMLPMPSDAEGQGEAPTTPPDNSEFLKNLPTPEMKKRAEKQMAERPWLKRINFGAVEKTMTSNDRRLSSSLAGICAKMRLVLEDQIVKIAGERSFGNIKPAEIVGVSLPKTLLTQFRKELRAAFSSALEESYEQARKELPKKQFARVRTSMDKTEAEKFLASKAMKITGVVEKKILDQVQLILENAIKYDKSLAATIKALMEDTDLLSLLPTVDSAGRAVNVPARLENIARTNISDAVNQGRMALFQDPALKGFVRAYEYSAILDDRTTEICEQLHGRVQSDWGEYTPPNHYQCRSLLIPITEVDTSWDGKQDAIPSGVKPQKGFA